MRQSTLTLCLIVLLVSAGSAFGQAITAVEPGSYDDVNTCNDQGAFTNVAGNPPPGIILQKGCTTATFAYAYADIITPLEGGPVSALTSAGFDVLNSSSCGSGSPRLNLVLNGGAIFVTGLGCAYGARADLGNGWSRITFSAADIATAVLAAGGSPSSTLDDMYILMDEGTDTPTSPYNTTQGTAFVVTPGTSFIDNIMINGDVVGAPAAAAPVPTASEAGLLALAGLLGLAAIFVMRRG
ncbi:MAG: hypothetical protein JO197_07855 [Acidobacteria bacterium]|nr:hypothetical protein [Acidobacteriota bacterium]MBV9475896.1 hypothetical protein [Acidobacteriota bacterium]